MNTRLRLTKPGRDGTECVYGTTDAGRYLLVVLAEAMDASERRSFTRQAR